MTDMDTNGVHPIQAAVVAIPSEQPYVAAIAQPVARRAAASASHLSADSLPHFSLLSLLIWTTLVGVLLGLSLRWEFFSFGLLGVGLFLWPTGLVVHEIASRLDARGGTVTSLFAAGLYTVGAMSFTVGIIVVAASVAVLAVEMMAMLPHGDLFA